MKKLFHLSLIILSQSIYGQNWNQLIKVAASDRNNNDHFAYSVSVSGNYAIAGAYNEDEDVYGGNTLSDAGSAYIFERDGNGNWVQVQKLTASDRDYKSWFGISVSISGNYAIIGAMAESKDAVGANYLQFAGAAYIFKRDGSGNWKEVQKLTASDRNTKDYFGHSVSISGKYAIVGSYFEDEDVSGGATLSEAGAAYIFECDGSGSWSEVQKIVASDRDSAAYFGNSVSISGNIAIAGALSEDKDASGGTSLTDAGSAYIFERDSSGNWNQVQKLVASDRDTGDNFGTAVSISDNYAIVGAPIEEEDTFGGNTVTEAGSAYVFKRDSSGSWMQFQKLIAPDRSYKDWFGRNLSVSGKYAIIGSWWQDKDASGGNNQFDAGAAYIFERNESEQWKLAQKIVASDRTTLDAFGCSVSISGKHAFIGAYTEDEDAFGENKLTNPGSAYFFAGKGITGFMYNDISEDCIRNVNEIGLSKRKAIIKPGNILVQSGNTGTWFVDSLPAGSYSITADTSGSWNITCPVTRTFTVVSPDTSVIAPFFGFVSKFPCTEPDISVYMPFMRPCFTGPKIYVQACNYAKATGALDSAYVLLKLDSLIKPLSSSLPYNAYGNNSYRIDVGSINPGSCVNFWVETKLSCNAILGQTLCMNASLYPADSCVFDTVPKPFPEGVSSCTLPWDKSSLSVKGKCVNDTIVFVVKNTGEAGDGDMQCYAPVRVFIDGQLIQSDSILLAGSDSMVFYYTGDGRTWRLEADQHPLHPGHSHPNATVEACGNQNNWIPGLVNTLSHDDADPVIDIYCGIVTGSYDPNDKTGYPLGTGTTHNIYPDGQMEYVIRFQNTGTDTAFTVVIRDTLDADLDIFSVNSGASSHAYTFSMYGPRVLQWTFNNILLPDSNVNEAASHGFVTFSVKQVPALPDGTKINNQAGIYFDYNAPVITNTTVHTIDRNLKQPSWTEVKNLQVEVCDEYTYNGITYTQAGKYWQMVKGASTDTLLSIEVSIKPPASVSLNEPMIIANNSNAAYQWLDCNNGFSLIPDETGQAFTAASSGNYAVVVTQSSCIDTSACVSVTVTGLQENTFSGNIILFPNPTDGNFSIEMDRKYESIHVTLADLGGREILEEEFTGQKKFSVSFNEASGIYLLTLSAREGRAVFRLMKK